MKLSFVLFLLTLSCSAYGRHPRRGFRNAFDVFEKSISKRIEDGNAIPIEKAPFMALVYADRSSHVLPYASAVIISDCYLLSSATFFNINRGKSMVAYLGASDLTSFESKNKYTVSNVTFHEEFFETDLYSYNIALIRLSKAITFNDKQRPIALLSDNDILDHYSAPSPVDIYGFGFTKIDSNDQTVLTTKKISIFTRRLQRERLMVVQNGYQGVKTLAGDIGAPLILDDRLVAINIKAESCDNSIVLTCVSAYYEWVLDVVGAQDLAVAELNAYPSIRSDDKSNFRFIL